MSTGNRPIDVSWAPRGKRRKGTKGKRKGKLIGLHSGAPQGLQSRSIAARTATRARGFISGGLPSLGKRK